MTDHSSSTSGVKPDKGEGEGATMSTGGANALLRVVVVGLGIAGRARVRDMPKLGPTTKGLEHVTLAGYVSRRSLGATDDGVPQVDLEEVLREDSDTQAVIIATENARHFDIARRAIEAKKHVCVDFPLTINAEQAKELFALAKSKGVLCYEEDIALITDRYQGLRKLIKAKESPLKEAEVTMTVMQAHEWMADVAASGSPFHTSMDLMHAQVDLFGDLTPQTCSITQGEGSALVTARATLKTHDNGVVNMTISYVTERVRAKTFKYTFEDGTVVDDSTPLEDMSEVNKDKPKGLFMRDVVQFVETVAGSRDNTYNEWLTIRSLEIADDLYRLSQNTPGKSEL